MTTRFDSPVTALIICMNEADLIGSTLQSVDFCAEIVVVDSGSTDGTIEIIERFRSEGFPIKLLHNEWSGFAPQRQFALPHATQPWCLSIEADEQADDDLRRSIKTIVDTDDPLIAGWYIRRRDWLDGYGFAHPWVLHNRLLRLFRREKGMIDVRVRIHTSYTVQGRTKVVKDGVLLHRRPMSVREDIARANSYSSLKAAGLAENARGPSRLKLFFSPPFTFLKFYLLKRYFLCGLAGFNYSATMAIYSFLTEAKLFEIARKPASSQPTE